ncbi:MAG: T9SS type A sorting domain-containing protein [Saprospiraceae bacterium]|nr:T9SS type A sorting domain-containing protein [Saprospiraceae bacterium]
MHYKEIFSDYSDPYAAFARALLHKLTKEHLEPEIQFPFEPRTRKESAREYNDEKVTIRPNPASEILNLHISVFKEEELYSVEILNTTGQLYNNKINSENKYLDISHLPAGVYYIKVKGSNGFNSVQRFIKI